MTAVRVISRILILGRAAAGRPEVLGGGNRVMQNPPLTEVLWAGRPDFIYWHFGALAMSQLDGNWWKTWNDPLREALLPRQKRDGCETGSWDPDDAWGAEGGRVYATAINVLTLETPYRFSPMLQQERER